MLTHSKWCPFPLWKMLKKVTINLMIWNVSAAAPVDSVHATLHAGLGEPPLFTMKCQWVHSLLTTAGVFMSLQAQERGGPLVISRDSPKRISKFSYLCNCMVMMKIQLISLWFISWLIVCPFFLLWSSQPLFSCVIASRNANIDESCKRYDGQSPRHPRFDKRMIYHLHPVIVICVTVYWQSDFPPGLL